MFTRALIVLLLVLNVGVAAWWALRPAALPAASIEQPAGVARLQLLGEAPQRTRAVPAAPVAATPSRTPGPSATTSAMPATGERCFAFGPFADNQANALAIARRQLQGQVVRSRVRQTQVGSGRGWHVFLPPFVDRAAAQAVVARIIAAGFEDYYVVPDGSNANGIELGRYGNEDAARRRLASLQTAGFTARTEPLDDLRTQYWIDLAAGVGFDPEAVRSRIGAAQAQPLDCASLG